MFTKLRIQGCFFDRWLRICYQFLQIQDGGSNMAVKNFKNCSIIIPLYTQFGKHSSKFFLNKKIRKISK